MRHGHVRAPSPSGHRLGYRRDTDLNLDRLVDRMRRYIVEFRDGSGYVSLNRRYWPYKIERVSDPLQADNYTSRKLALDTVSAVSKAKRRDYVTRALNVEVTA